MKNNKSPLHAITFLAPNMYRVYAAMMQHVSQKLAYPIELTVGEDYAEVAQADLSFICGLPYVLRTAPRQNPSMMEAIAAPVLRGERYQGKPIYFSDVIVRRDSPYQQFADLRGCRWAYNEPESQSGYGITRYSLLKMGETAGFFGTVIQAGFHQTAMEWVCAGKIDAAAIDSQVLETEMRHHPALVNQLRIIHTFGPSTIQPIVVTPRIPTNLKNEIQAALIEMHTDPEMKAALAWGDIDRLVAVSAADYDDIRAMLTACEQAHFLTIR